MSRPEALGDAAVLRAAAVLPTVCDDDDEGAAAAAGGDGGGGGGDGAAAPCVAPLCELARDATHAWFELAGARAAARRGGGAAWSSASECQVDERRRFEMTCLTRTASFDH